jgi:hypothetical protein
VGWEGETREGTYWLWLLLFGIMKGGSRDRSRVLRCCIGRVFCLVCFTDGVQDPKEAESQHRIDLLKLGRGYPKCSSKEV